MRAGTGRFAAENPQLAGGLSIIFLLLFLPLSFWMCLFVIPHYLYPFSLMHSTELPFGFACWKKLRHVVCDIFLGKQRNEINEKRCKPFNSI